MAIYLGGRGDSFAMPVNMSSRREESNHEQEMDGECVVGGGASIWKAKLVFDSSDSLIKAYWSTLQWDSVQDNCCRHKTLQVLTSPQQLLALNFNATIAFLGRELELLLDVSVDDQDSTSRCWNPLGNVGMRHQRRDNLKSLTLKYPIVSCGPWSASRRNKKIKKIIRYK